MDFILSPRPSPIAGTWYSGDPARLRSEIEAFINVAKISDDEFLGEVFGIISPHAGYQYSGKTAGYAYKIIQGLKRDIVVILSPFHQYFPGDLITTPYNSYQTPLGVVPVAEKLVTELADILSIENLPIIQVERDQEHSLEIQLPFLQCALADNFQLLPLMVRTRDKTKLQRIADTLMRVLKDRSFLVVASTDLSHFFPLDIAQQMDAEMLHRIKVMDVNGILSAEQEGTASACGASSVAVLLNMAGKITTAKTYILNYSTSADETGDMTSVVGYGSAAIFI